MTTGIRLCVLASGSRGNCIYLQAGSTECLIDAGLSCEAIEKRLEAIGASLGRIRHVFITHEHADHISGLRVLSRKYDFRVHTNRATYLQVGSLLPRNADVHLFDGPYRCDDMDVVPFPVPHDAVDPVGFSFIFMNKKVAVATDLGRMTPAVAEGLRESDAIVLESNHDPEMLRRGSYPMVLKQRIAGSTGHLSNIQTCELLTQVWSDRLQHVCLAHLSQENNSPDTARRIVKAHLASLGSNGHRTALHLTYQDRPGDLIVIP